MSTLPCSHIEPAQSRPQKDPGRQVGEIDCCPGGQIIKAAEIVAKNKDKCNMKGGQDLGLVIVKEALDPLKKDPPYLSYFHMID